MIDPSEVVVIKHEASPSPASLDEEPRKKRKKASRACAACQRAHLTCDDGRPCERCIKRGCADTCQDGKRKKAKYLRDIEDELVERRHNPALSTPTLSSSTPSGPPAFSMDTALPLPPRPEESQSPVDASFYDGYVNSPERQGNAELPAVLDGFSTLEPPSLYAGAVNFGSENANLEYSMLNELLDGFVEPLPFGQDDIYSTAPPSFASAGPSNGFTAGASTSAATPPAGPVSQVKQEFFGPNASASPSTSTAIARSAPSPAGSSTSNGVGHGLMKPDDVYTAVVAPYPYTQGYHDLIQHLKEKFDREDIVRVIRALALFRPSLIALQMPLSEEDEIFVEKCFQRTLIEYEKLIALSGTPTVVWRRTCEICLVGPEFCMLTKWKREDLIGRKRYIFELFDNASVVNYYENMAAHAFENTTSTVMMSCNLLQPSGKTVPCSFCFSIKRDIFSIPSLIVGQFLPRLDAP